MNIEALIAVGVAVLLLGVPLFWVSRRWLRSASGANAKSGSPRVTKTGLLVAVVVVVLLIGGFAASYYAPDSAFGQFMSNPLGRLAYALAVGFLSIPLHRWLRARGMDLYSTGSDDRPPGRDGRRP